MPGSQGCLIGLRPHYPRAVRLGDGEPHGGENPGALLSSGGRREHHSQGARASILLDQNSDAQKIWGQQPPTSPDLKASWPFL